MSPHASTLVSVSVPLLATLTVIAVGSAIRHVAPAEARSAHTQRYATAVVAWLGFTAALAASGLLARADARPPAMLLVLVPTLGLPLAVGLSAVGARLARQMPLWLLVGFHAFRLPLELVMHQAALEGTMPVQMSFSGLNFDVLTGATALGVAALARSGRAPRSLLVGWSVLGTALLLAIVVIAVASLPIFHAFGTEPSWLNTWVAHFPFVWLPAGLVASAVLGHVVLWRRLLEAGAPSTARVAPTRLPAPSAP